MPRRVNPRAPVPFLLIKVSPVSKLTVYYFNRHVPADLQGIVADLVGEDKPVRLWRETCHTTDPRTAAEFASRRRVETDLVLADARREHARRESLMARMTPAERDRINAAGGLDAFRKRGIITAKRATYLEAGANALASVAPHVIDQDDLEESAASATGLAQKLVADAMRDADLWKRAADPQGVRVVDRQAGQPQPERAKTLQDALDWWADQTKAPKQHVEQYRYALDRFAELHSSVDMEQVTIDHLHQFVEALRRLPNSTRRDVRTASILEAGKLAERDKLPLIGETTVKKHITALSTVYGFAIERGWAKDNPVRGFKVRGERKKVSIRKQEKTRAFTAEEMARLFGAIEGEFSEKHDDFWIPMVAAYQGTRLEETCQLRPQDVEQIDGIWTLKITDDGENMKIKAAASHRTIPLHPKLLEKGFLQHVDRARGGGDRIFRSLLPDARGRLGGPYSKRFARRLREGARIVDDRVVFHSLRKTFISAAKRVTQTEQERAMRFYLEGHQDDAETAVSRVYLDGAPASLADMRGFMAKVDPFA